MTTTIDCEVVGGVNERSPVYLRSGQYGPVDGPFALSVRVCGFAERVRVGVRLTSKP